MLREIPKVLDSVPVNNSKVCKSWRFIGAYEKGLEGRIAEWAVKKYNGFFEKPN